MLIKKYMKYLNNIDMFIAGLSLVIILVITCVGVAKRYVLNDPLTWLEEIQVWLFSWLTFFGGSVCFKNRSHVAIEIFTDKFSPKIQKIIEVIIYALSIIVLAYFIIQCSDLLNQYIATNKTTDVLRIPRSINIIGVMLGSILMIVNYTIHGLTDVFRKDKEAE